MLIKKIFLIQLNILFHRTIIQKKNGYFIYTLQFLQIINRKIKIVDITMNSSIVYNLITLFNSLFDKIIKIKKVNVYTINFLEII
jgi:hypothetical protein